MPTDEGTIVIIYCPRCDRPFYGSTKKTATKRALFHVTGQHPDMDNPFESDED